MALNQNTELGLINTTANAGTIVLPLTSLTPGRVITFKDSVTQFGVNALTLQTSGSDTFEDGSTTKILRENNGIIQVVASGTSWYILTGTQQDTVNISTLQALSVSSINISTNNLLVSSLNTTIYQQSTLAYFNSNIFAGSRVYPQTVLNRTTFSPRNIQNLALWLDAADPFNNGTVPAQSTLMSNWTDKSTFRDDAFQTTVGNQPNYNTNGFINFNGSNAFFNLSDISFVVNTAFSIFMVEQRQSASGNYIFNGLNANFVPLQTLHIGYRNNTGFTFAFWGVDLDAGVTAFTTLATEPFRIWSLIYTGSTRTIFLNGTSVTTQLFSNNLNATANGRIGSNNFNTPSLYSGNIREIIGTKPSIDGFVRQQTEGYLAWKWGLQANLPASHLFRNAPPQ